MGNYRLYKRVCSAFALLDHVCRNRPVPKRLRTGAYEGEQTAVEMFSCVLAKILK